MGGVKTSEHMPTCTVRGKKNVVGIYGAPKSNKKTLDKSAFRYRER